jgi:hypothetical protein
LQQTADDTRYFLIGGIAAFLIVFLFLFGFFLLMFVTKKPKTYGLKKDTYVSVSLQTLPQVQKKQAPQKQAPKKQVKTKTKKKKLRKKIDAISENVDVDSLFNNVWTKKITPKKKVTNKPDIKRIQAIEKSLESVESALNTTTKTSKHKNASKKKDIKASSTGEEVNKYLAKIHAIVYDHFYPPPNTEGYVVRAVIELSPFGKVVDFRILNYSGNEALDKEVDAISKRIRHVVFPQDPDGKSERIVIILKPENKE